MFLKLGFINGGFFPCLDHYDVVFHVLRASQTKGRVLREQKFTVASSLGLIKSC